MNDEQLTAEIERLRAENAKLRRWIGWWAVIEKRWVEPPNGVQAGVLDALGERAMTMSDTTTALTNQQIAARLGWRMIKTPIPAGVHHSGQTYGWLLHAPGAPTEWPHGRLVAWGDVTEDRAWIDAQAAGEGEPDLPDFRHDANAALSLPLPEGLFFVLMGNAGGWTCSVSPRLGVVEGDVEHGADPADVASRSWWQFMQMQTAR
jgi:hypothetical protein